MNFLRKSGPLDHFWTRNLLENAVCLLKDLDIVGDRLEHDTRHTEITEMSCTNISKLVNPHLSHKVNSNLFK
jgi:hypothetical protein